MRTSILLIFLLVFFSCQNTNTSTTPQTTTPNPYPHIPIAEKGITVVNPDGWTEQNMTFHIDYCGQMLGSIANEYDPSIFCPCFLEKIQYYYKPVHFKEAYEDQKKWNEECMKKAEKNQ